uniref:Uncharacterized protein n=1 Tax=Magnetospirillum gryphiswaldense TaxID=55518 RepID=A4U0C1_9PROT|nr:hypothetical protein MGR_2132 [Magnetospirillum gryphiswaldense MSR-1]
MVHGLPKVKAKTNRGLRPHAGTLGPSLFPNIRARTLPVRSARLHPLAEGRGLAAPQHTTDCGKIAVGKGYVCLTVFRPCITPPLPARVAALGV